MNLVIDDLCNYFKSINELDNFIHDFRPEYSPVKYIFLGEPKILVICKNKSIVHHDIIMKLIDDIENDIILENISIDINFTQFFRGDKYIKIILNRRRSLIFYKQESYYSIYIYHSSTDHIFFFIINSTEVQIYRLNF